mmetsp:Transcript_43432/g.108882  ORF Transcript_43432/g.108882 Transcript_43432/m.108882 type:complete len:178 (+) Transcript_43432:110-643(+)
MCRAVLQEHHGQEGHDVFKDSLLRYLGYSNEVGEAFRPMVHSRFVTASYAVAGAYVLADTADKVNVALNNERIPKQARNHHALERGLDTLIWQGLASVVIPGATINRIVWATGKLPLPPKAKSVVPTAVGLASIPLIIYPIDLVVHHALDRTSRPVLRSMTRAKFPSDAGLSKGGHQ